MVIQKTAVYKVLAIVLALFLLMGSSERVEAAPQSKYVYITTDEYHESGLAGPITFTTEYSLSYSSDNLKDIKSFAYYINGDKRYYYAWIYSEQQYEITYCQYEYQFYPDGTLKSVIEDTTKTVSGIPFTLSNGKIIYRYFDVFSVRLGFNNRYEESRTDFFSSIYNITNYENNQKVLDDVLCGILEPEVLYEEETVPIWSQATLDPVFMINNFQAEIVEDNLVMKWDPVTYLPYRTFENMYIHFRLKQRPLGSVYEGNNRRNNLPDIGYCKMSDLGITVTLDDLNISENYILSSVTAVPYYYVGDNPENELKNGNSSYIVFDNDGLSSNPIIVDPVIDPDVEPEKVEQNIFYSIQNFFSGFFRNLTNTIKTAVVPSGDDVLALLQEMNDWFSVRFGFIWYPFDLAIDIMAAFALGEPDSKITVPALTLNMFGGVKLWDEFQADLDPIDFLKYVRFFTSTIMCCGTVSLAIRKWDEWIGGRSS